MGCDCDKGIGDALPPGVPPGSFPGALFVKFATIRLTGVARPAVVLSLPAAQAIDVYLGTKTDNAVFLQVNANQGLTSAKVGYAGFASSAEVNGRFIAIRDFPANSFDIVADTLGGVAGTTTEIDVVVIGWGKEPTGIGPLELSALTTSDNPNHPVGFLPMVRLPTSAPAGQVTTLIGGSAAPHDLASASLGTELNTLPMSQFQAAPATKTDLQVGALQSDNVGNLKVILSGAAGAATFPAAAALGDTDANPTTTRIGADVQWWDGTQWVRARCGVIAAGTATGWGNVLAGGVFNTAAPTLTNGQGVTLQLTSAGNLKNAEQFQAVAEDNTNGVIATVEKPLNATTYNATASDSITAANAGTFKTSAGTLYKAYFTNSNAAGKIYALVNKASAPVNGDVPLMYFRVPATTTFALEFRFGKRFTTGIAWAEVTTIAATITLDTADTVANAEVM